MAVPPPPHVCGPAHVPHERVPPQPFATVPQSFPRAEQVVGVQPVPQVFGVPPPPQVAGSVQAPQARVPPQPFEMVPHVFPWAAQVVGVQG